MPVYRRFQERIFKCSFKKEYAIVTLDQVVAKFTGGSVNRESLVLAGLLSGRNKNFQLKILSKGEDLKTVRRFSF